MSKPAGSRARPSRVLAATLFLVSAGALALLSLGARLPEPGRRLEPGGAALRSHRQERPADDDRWLRYVEMGDALAQTAEGAVAGRDRAGLTARKAYLLAFYEAYDRNHVHRMAVAAQRLDLLGEADLARHIRRVLAEYPYPGEVRD